MPTGKRFDVEKAFLGVENASSGYTCMSRAEAGSVVRGQSTLKRRPGLEAKQMQTSVLNVCSNYHRRCNVCRDTRHTSDKSRYLHTV